MKRLHWYNCCNHGEDNQRVMAHTITKVTCRTCLRRIQRLGLVDPSTFPNLEAVPAPKRYCPVCGHELRYNFDGHWNTHHRGCPVKGLNVTYNKGEK